MDKDIINIICRNIMCACLPACLSCYTYMMRMRMMMTYSTVHILIIYNAGTDPVLDIIVNSAYTLPTCWHYSC